MSTGILVDTNILIEYFRTRERRGSRFDEMRNRHAIHLSVVTEYEILNGMTESHRETWDDILRESIILPVDRPIVQLASRINIDLKRKRQQIDLADLFIAATAIAHGLPLATLNRNHFQRIDGLKLVLSK